LVDVDTTGPSLIMTLGMIREEVFPDRGGPRTITDCSGGTKHQPRSLWPRYTPWWACADASSMLRISGELARDVVVSKILFT
jgi:hypothetical protein